MSLQLIDPSEIKFGGSSVIAENVGGSSVIAENVGNININEETKAKIGDIIKRMGIERVLRAHRIGYACVNMSIDATTNKTCRLENCNEDRLRSLISSNLDGMKKIIEWNIKKNIMLYRISSIVIPFATHDVNTVRWWEDYKDKLMEIGRLINDSGMRVSMHPGQYVNINSPNRGVLDFSIKELEYHAKFMDLLGLDNIHRMILHVGGAYGDKKASIKRFVDVFGTLSGNIRSRLTIENDDKIYNVWDAINVSSQTGMPVVFDLLHHQVNHVGLAEDKDIKLILEKCFSTWNKDTGIPKIHFSTQRPNAKYGVHNDAVDLNMLMNLYVEFINYDFDIMLETKDKDISVLRAKRILESY